MSLLPVGSNHRCQGGLVVRRQGGLSRRRRCERGHGGNQVLHLGVEQGLGAVGGLELLDMVGGTAIPVADGHLVAGADDADFQVGADVPEPKLVVGDPRQELGNVGVADGCVSIDHGVNAVAASELVGVITGSTRQGVRACTSVQGVVAGFRRTSC